MKPKITTRSATPAEVEGLFSQPGYETYAVILEVGGVRVGHCCLSFDKRDWHAHELFVGPDPNTPEVRLDEKAAFLNLGKAVVAKAKALGAAKMVAHIMPGVNQKTVDFYLAHGFQVKATILELDLTSL